MKASRCMYHEDTGKYYPLSESSFVTIGRAFDNRIILDDPLASRHHAAVEVRAGHVFLRDLKSTNGTSLQSGETLGLYARELTLFDKFKIGSSTFQILEEEIVRTKNYVYKRTPGDTVIMYPGN